MGPFQESVVLRRALLILATITGVVLSVSAADRSMDERAANAAREGLARKGQFKPSVGTVETHRQRVQALSERATRRGLIELDRLRAKQDLPEAGVPGSTHKADETAPNIAGRVVVALSSSMPEAMLTSYMQQLDRRPESLVVLRGFVGGAHKVKPTGLLMEKIRRKVAGDPQRGHYRVETVVDPLFFEQLGIDKVPAVAYLEGVQSLAHCNQEDYSKATVIYGAGSIEAALKEARKAGAAVPDRVIAQYRGIGWEHTP
jgi:type-F conjugative transfer system pilin assembly protein TrbC